MIRQLELNYPVHQPYRSELRGDIAQLEIIKIERDTNFDCYLQLVRLKATLNNRGESSAMIDKQITSITARNQYLDTKLNVIARTIHQVGKPVINPVFTEPAKPYVDLKPEDVKIKGLSATLEPNILDKLNNWKSVCFFEVNKVICDMWDIAEQDLISSSKYRDSNARALALFIMANKPNLKQQKIAAVYRVTHWTVSSNKMNFKAKYASGHGYRQKCNQVFYRLGLMQ
jgi:hypothetical protein